MTGPEARPDVDEDFLADVFARFVEDLLDGRTPRVAELVEARRELEGRIVEIHELARRVAGRDTPRLPSFEDHEIVRELGRGGMGTVYLARQSDLGRNVALKILPPAVALSTRARRRFLDEARSMARLTDDRIVRIHRVIERDDSLAYTMEWIDGPSLRDVMLTLRRRHGAPTLAELAAALGTDESELGAKSYQQYLVQLGITIARALGVVHRAGIVHRDVKPSNILIRRDGRPLLADFGLARVSESSLTLSGAFLGTPSYAPPEQLRGGDDDQQIDGRADVYSLAVTLFEAVAQEPPFTGRDAIDVLRNIEDGAPQSLRKLAPDTPRDLETILRMAMEPDPSARYATADEFADDLERLSSLQPIRARRAGLLKRSTKFLRRQRRSLVAALVGAILVALAWILIDGHLRGRAAIPQQVDELIASARHRLLAAADQVWQESARERTTGPRAPSAEPLASARQIREVLALYGEGLRLDPEDAELELEYDIVAFASHLGRRTDQELDAELDAWRRRPPLTLAFARRLVQRRSFHQPLLREIDGATTGDRYALGLLAFLIGQVAICQRAWEAIDPVSTDFAVVNAALGVLHQADGNASHAYPRLLRAVRDFPAIGQLKLALADVALELGDTRVAAGALERAAESQLAADAEPRLARIRADLCWQNGERERAAEIYRGLVAADAGGPLPRLRMAQAALARGERTLALQRMRELLRRWPRQAKLRRVAAAMALETGEWPLYFEQARHVLVEQFGLERSEHGIAELLEVLRLGGLRRLHAIGLAVTGQHTSLDRMTAPVVDWQARLPALRLEPTERALAQAACFEMLGADMAPRANSTGPERRLELTLAFLCRAWSAAGPLRALLRSDRRLAIDMAVLLTIGNWRSLRNTLSRVVARLLPAAATAEWQRLRCDPAPPPHSSHVLVADRHGLLLFGGWSADRDLQGRSWRWDGERWRSVNPPTEPPARMRQSAAFDPDRDRIVMFGGSRTNRGGLFDDTWEFDGQAWSKIATAAQPTARNDHAMGWDPVGRRILLFGGRDESGYTDDTWAWDGSDWTELRPRQHPPARRDHRMACDLGRRRLVSFGGSTATGRFLADVWEWDGRDWQQIEPPVPIEGRAGTAFAYDPIRGSCLLFSGHTGTVPADTWEWNGSRWRRCEVLGTPSGRSGHAMAFDPQSRRLVLFGGYEVGFLGDTWVLTERD